MNAPSFAVFDRHGAILPDTIRTGPGAEQAAKDAACTDKTYWMTRLSTWGELERQGFEVAPFDVRALQQEVMELRRRHEEDCRMIHELRNAMHVLRINEHVREAEGGRA